MKALNDVSYIKQQKLLFEFYSLFIVVVFSVFFILFVFLSKSEESAAEIEPLSQEQQRLLIQQLGSSGFKETLKNRCYLILEIKMQTGKWTDNWCMTKYQHLKLR